MATHALALGTVNPGLVAIVLERVLNAQTVSMVISVSIDARRTAVLADATKRRAGAIAVKMVSMATTATLPVPLIAHPLDVTKVVVNAINVGRVNMAQTVRKIALQIAITMDVIETLLFVKGVSPDSWATNANVLEIVP